MAYVASFEPCQKSPRVNKIIENDPNRCKILGYSYEQIGNTEKANEWYLKAEHINNSH